MFIYFYNLLRSKNMDLGPNILYFGPYIYNIYVAEPIFYRNSMEAQGGVKSSEIKKIIEKTRDIVEQKDELVHKIPEVTFFIHQQFF